MALFTRQALDELLAGEARTAPRNTVMVVDDIEANLSVMEAILRPDYQLLLARDAQEALALIDALPDPTVLACVVSDYRMPRMNGVLFLEQVRERCPDATRLIVTGFIDVDAIIDSINKAGIFKFVVKPFSANEFLQIVREAVDLFLLQRERDAERRALISEVAALRARAG